MPEKNSLPEPPGIAMAYDAGQQHEIAAIAEWQLMKWQQRAQNWRVSVSRHGQEVAIHCTWCGEHILWLTKDGIPYAWEFGQLQSQLVLHMRNKHRDLEHEVYYG